MAVIWEVAFAVVGGANEVAVVAALDDPATASFEAAEGVSNSAGLTFGVACMLVINFALSQ